MTMRTPVELDPDVDDEAPTGNAITAYDERHYVTYLRLLDAKAEGADWKEVARIVLHRDPVAYELRTYRCWQSHLERAQWLSRDGYRKILKQAAANESGG
ncbi:DNA -binding domain-containing protein [Paracoccus sediminicola]